MTVGQKGSSQSASVDLSAAGRRLAGRVPVIVGAGSTNDDAAYPGTGAAIARIFAAAGASVYVIGRSEKNTERTLELIKDGGGIAFGLTGDASNTATCEEFVNSVVGAQGGIDVLVNNLGYTEGKGIADTDDGAWDRVIAVNLRSPVAMTRAAAPYLCRSGHGAVIFVSAVTAFQANGAAAYCTTKAGLLGLSRDTAYNLGRHGVRSNCIVPGHLYTPGAQNKPEGRELRRRLSMLETEGTGWDAGWAALYLASDEARYVTATEIFVDGGVTSQLTQSVVTRLG